METVPEDKLPETPDAQHYEVNGSFIGIDVCSFRTPVDVVPVGLRPMKNRDLEMITAELTVWFGRPIMHTMPGNDITCEFLPFKQWKQSGRGLAIPYQRDQESPRTGIPNLWVSPIPCIFKKSENNSLGRQCYLIKRYIRQLYYYAGLGFCIAVPVRPASEGSEKDDGSGNRPSAFDHDRVRPASALGKCRSKNDFYEYAFGAGKYPDFCKNHGQFLEQELNQLETFLAENNNSEQSFKKRAKNDYHQAFNAGLDQREDFLKYFNAHRWANKDTSAAIDRRFILGGHIDKQFMRLYEPPIPENALINDPQLRERLEALILQLKIELEPLNEGCHEHTEKTCKCNALIALFHFQASTKSEDEKNSVKDEKQRCQKIALLIKDKVDYENSPVRHGAFSRTDKLLTEIQEKYPAEPREPDITNGWWVPIDFTGLITRILTWLYAYEVKTYQEKIDALTPKPPTDLPDQNHLVLDCIYCPLILDRPYEPGFFSSSSPEIQASINRQDNLDGYYSWKAAAYATSKLKLSPEQNAVTMVLKKEADGKFSGYVCEIEKNGNEHFSDSMRGIEKGNKIGDIPITEANNAKFSTAFENVQARIDQTLGPKPSSTYQLYK